MEEDVRDVKSSVSIPPDPKNDSVLQVALSKEHAASLLQQLYQEDKLKEREVNSLSRAIMSKQGLLSEFMKMEETCKLDSSNTDRILSRWILSKVSDPIVQELSSESSPYSPPTMSPPLSSLSPPISSLSTSNDSSFLSSPSPASLQTFDLKKDQVMSPESPFSPTSLSHPLSTDLKSEYHLDSVDHDTSFPHYLTVAEFVVRLVNFEQKKFRSIFMLHYRKFITPPDLLQKLALFFYNPPPEGKSPHKSLRSYLLSTTPPAQSLSSLSSDVDITPRDRVLLCLNYWIREYYYCDFTSPMRKQLSDFLTHAQKIHDTPACRLVLESLEQQEKKSPDPVQSEKNEKLHQDLLKISPSEIAKELSLIQFQLFRKIRPLELTNHRWISKDKTVAPNVQAFVEQFNCVTYWVASEILERKHVQDRISAVQHFIGVANECLALRNFHSLFAIVAALQSHPVFRLKELKTAFTSYYQKLINSLIKITSSDENYKCYRPLYKHAVTNGVPCIPHLAIAFKDLSVYEETTPYERQNDVIDIHRLQRISSEISEILVPLQNDYVSVLGLRSSSKLQTKLRLDISKAKTLDQLLKRSLHLEPKRTAQQQKEHQQQMAINVLLEEGFL